MASNGQWAESVIKVMRGKLDELNKQVAAVKEAIATVEAGFDMPALTLPTMFQEVADKQAAEADEARELALLERDKLRSKLPNIEDTPTP